MAIVNTFFSQGTKTEQYLLEDLIIESIRMYGQELMYIPRTLVAKDEILGEDRLSKFEGAFPIVAYFENIDSFSGNGFFLSKFGMFVEQSASLVLAKRTWDITLGQYNVTILNRPAEGDLIYFPLSKGLFEIKFVEHQNPFYQLGKLYTFKLQIELFQYASEKLDTGVPEIDIFESLKTHSTDPNISQFGTIESATITNIGAGYTTIPTITVNSTNGIGAELEVIMGTGDDSDKLEAIIVINGGTNYDSNTTLTIVGTNTTQATAIPVIVVNIDEVHSFGDNNKFKEEFSFIDPNNPFNDVN